MMSNIISFNVQTKVLPTKGNLVYEYNPFRNYRLTQIKYEYQEQLYTEQELEDNFNIIIDKTYEVVPNATLERDKKIELIDSPVINVSITAFKDGSYRQHFKIEGRDSSNNPVTDECGNYLPNGTPAVSWVVRYNNKLYWEDDFLSNINSIFTYTIGTQWLKKTVVEGKEIYEGDIIERDGIYSRYLVKYDTSQACWVLSYESDYIYLGDFADLKVIGNIFQSPELLERV